MKPMHLLVIPGPHNTDDIFNFQGHRFKGQSHRQHFLKVYFSFEGMPLNDSPSKTVWFNFPPITILKDDTDGDD